MNLPKELQELRANVEVLTNKYKQLKADAPAQPSVSADDQRMCDMEDAMYQMVSYIHNRVSGLEDNFYNYQYQHAQNHLPNPATPSDMQAALDALGLSKDYEVKRRIIMASSKNLGFELHH